MALAVIWTWPLTAHLATRIPHDPGDPILNIWILWWNAHAIPFTARWWSPPILVPLPGALALSEHLAGLGPITTPIQLAGGSALLAYNVALLASYALSGWFTYLLVHRLTGSPLASFCSGLAFAFAPYRAGQLAHIQVLTSQWMPAMLLALHGYLSDGRRRWLVAFATAWLVQALSNGYYLLFFPVLLVLWMAWFVDWRGAPRRGIAIGIAWLIASLPLIPVLVAYRNVQETLGLARTADEIGRFSATAGSFLHAAPLLAFWRAQEVSTQEDYLFPGITAIALVLAGLTALAVRRDSQRVNRSSALIFYALATVVLWTLTLGPGEPGTAAWLRPYRWLSILPGYAGLRAPARFAMLASLCLSVGAGLALARLRPASRRTWLVLCAAAAAGITIDGWLRPMPLAAPPPRVMLAGADSAPVIEVPPDDARVSVAAMYRAMFHRRPLVNGYTGYVAPHYTILSMALRRGDASPLLELARDRGLLVIVNDRPDQGAQFRPMIEELPGVERLGTGGAGTVYRLPASSRKAPADGERIPVNSSTLESERLTLDLSTTRVVRSITFPLRWRYEELGERIQIDASEDGQAWRTVWRDWTGGPAMAAALEDPLVVPVRIALNDVRTRYLRIYPAPAWLERETIDVTIASR
jgi:hypothetical protein